MKYVIERYKASTNDKSFYITQNANGTLGFFMSANGTTIEASPSTNSIIDDGLGHVIKYYGNASELFIYVDDVFDKKTTKTASIYDSDEPVHLGVLNQDNNYWAGKLSNVEFLTGFSDIDVYCIIGQSNAEGRPLDYGTLSTALQGNNLHSYTYSMSMGLGSYTATGEQLAPYSSSLWGLEITFGERIFSRSGRRVAIIKVTKGGTSINTNWQKGGDMYNEFISVYQNGIADLIAKGYNPTFRQMIEINGESDSTTLQKANDFLINHDKMISDMENDLSITIANKIIIAKMHDSLPIASYPYQATVKAHQETLGCRAGNCIINNDGASVNPDDIHYDNAWLQILGYAIADASYLSVVEGDIFFSNALNEQDGNIA